MIKRLFTERRGQIIIGIVVGIIVIGGILAWELTESDTFCVSCHDVMGGYDEMLEQSPHAGEHCVDCHGEESFTEALKVKMFEDPKHAMAYIGGTYGEPHAEITNEFCERCHETASMGNRQLSDVGFDHVIHTAGLECETCHGRVAHGYEPMPTGHDNCACHQGEIRDTAKCGMCHGTTVALNE